MKHLIPLLILFAAASLSRAQTPQTISIGTGYTDHVWYSLEDGEVARSSKSAWDLAFEISGFTASILVNHVNANALWVYPHGDTADWATLDTAGIESWPQVYNTDTSWAWGAFNVNKNLGNSMDLGWGQYNMITHQVVGDSLFVIRNGNTFKKLWIVALAGGTYSFRMANLDGSNEIERTLAKPAFAGRNFGYYSIVDDQNKNLEPNQQEWDLLFTQYAANIPFFGAYPSTGVLQNAGVHAVKAYPVEDTETYEEHQTKEFSSAINTIGYQWKNYDFASASWMIADSTVYFVRAKNGALWKLVFTGFGGSSTGDYMFNKTLIEESPDTIPTGISPDISTNISLNVFPNPANGGLLQVIYSSDSPTVLQLYNLQGALLQSKSLEASVLGGASLDLNGLSSGVYLVHLVGNKEVKSQRLLIQ
jgi:hypothetical protein